MEHIQKDDPRLTAYALGELPAEEAEQVAQAIERDPELAAEVQALRELAGALRQTLQNEPLPTILQLAPAEQPANGTDAAADGEALRPAPLPGSQAMPVAGGRRMWWYALSGCAAAAAITFSLMAWRGAQAKPIFHRGMDKLAGEPVLQPGTDGGTQPNPTSYWTNESNTGRSAEEADAVKQALAQEIQKNASQLKEVNLHQESAAGGASPKTPVVAGQPKPSEPNRGTRPDNRVVVKVDADSKYGVGMSTQDPISGSVTLTKRNFQQPDTSEEAAMNATMNDLKQEMEAMRGQMAKEREAMRAAGGNPEALKSANGKATVKIGGGQLHVRYNAADDASPKAPVAAGQPKPSESNGGTGPDNRVAVKADADSKYGVGMSTQDPIPGSVTLSQRNFDYPKQDDKAVLDGMKRKMEALRIEKEALLSEINAKREKLVKKNEAMRAAEENPNQQAQEAITEELKKADENWATDIKDAKIMPQKKLVYPLDMERIQARAKAQQVQGQQGAPIAQDKNRGQAPESSLRDKINVEVCDIRDIAAPIANAKKMPEVNNEESAAPDSVRQQSAPSNTESYDKIEENEFLRVSEQPLSTFSIDVDTASYSNLRRLINAGQLPPAGAVRIEELVNYFDYDYQPPQDGTPFATHMALAACPWSPEHQLLRVGLKGKIVAESERPECNLVFLLDVSGSMDQPNKLPLVREGMKLLVNKLRDTDRVAIAVYAGASGLVLPSTPCSQRQTILNAIDNLSPGGSTNGAAGITLAYATAASGFLPKGVNRVVLCTDGDFNVGVTNQSELTDLIEKKAKEGVFLTVLGFGMGNLKDSTLEKLADKGNGNYGYIDTLAEAKKLLVDQMSGTLMTIAKDVKIQIEFNPQQVQGYRLIGYENRKLNKEDFNDDKKDAGEIGAGHTVTALYELIPAGTVWPAQRPAVDPLKYQTPAASPVVAEAAKEQVAGRPMAASAERLTLKLRYKEPDGEVSKLLTFPLTGDAKKWEEADGDLRFAASVAAWGMLLRHSAHAGNANLNTVAAWAEAAKGSDPSGYRAEFLKLVRMSASLNNR